ncbi:MAG: Ig-like domain-containing protein [Thaumarchaeota archaeon]|nr:Ig-like domain-containing protein [Nitrososphaerota archaeon]MDE1818147.1 Ig-like domain-containing protein [Nitrososphaerota archaeon]MDE1875869.1 Ig-like domain-containing protein [Nitrososphaerota archaeon]
MKSYADNDYTFGVRIMPQKLIENSDGILQVYALNGNHIYPQKIDNMVFSSTDSSIIQVIGIEKGNGFITNIKLKTLGQGDAKIEIGAPGFVSQEIPITVYGNQNYPVKLLVQSTPTTLSINGPNMGYFTVELINNNGLPATSKNDILVNLDAADSKIAMLTDTHLLIKAGEYYGIERFEVTKVGTTEIFASANSLQPSSATVTVNQIGSPTIHMYVYPAKINNYQASTSYAVAQLTDASGNLIPAKEDIVIPVSINDPNANLTNSSPVIQNVESNAPIIIKKGSYWGYTNIAVSAGTNGTYNVLSSTPNGYVNSVPSQITTFTTKFYDDKSARLDILPILATGNDELIGVLHLEDNSGNPIIASHDMQIEIDSSDVNSLAVDDVMLNKGSGAALVFAKVGTSIPISLSLHVVTYNDQTVNPVISLPTSNSLNARSLVPKISSNTDFPIAVYPTDPSGNQVYFTNDSPLNAISNDYVSIQQSTIHKGDSIILVNSTSLKTGTSTVNILSNNDQTSITLQSFSNLPSQVVLDYSDPILMNIKNTMVAQILDLDAKPVFAQKDIVLKLISSNKDVLTLPENITIGKGQYYTPLEITPKSIGTSQVSIFADDMPLVTYKITVDQFSPTLSIIAPDSVLPGESLIASVTALDHGNPLKNMSVHWNVGGATIQNSDSITNQNGTANIVLLANSNSSTINLNVNATGLGYIPSHASKMVNINGTDGNVSYSNSTTGAISQIGKVQANLKAFKVGGIDTLPIVVLGTIAISGVLIKKKSLFSFKKTSSRINMQPK